MHPTNKTFWLTKPLREKKNNLYIKEIKKEIKKKQKEAKAGEPWRSTDWAGLNPGPSSFPSGE
jgi:hypothetical protein